ncbi:hypothetical protein LZ30DRAFT_729263 [Colletotrichum cereale]|nr:hypothetical protein LZ30DRAFT_729263 [Colletotrichum cereale]
MMATGMIGWRLETGWFPLLSMGWPFTPGLGLPRLHAFRLEITVYNLLFSFITSSTGLVEVSIACCAKNLIVMWERLCVGEQ